MKKQDSIQISSKTSLLISTERGLVLRKGAELTPSTCWEQGHNIRALYKTNPQWTIAMLVMELGKLVDFVDAKKTLKTEEELLFTCETLIEEFPAMTLEEFVLVFKMIKQGKFGKLYERLKLAEISDCCKRYEGEQRAEVLEAKAHDYKEHQYFDPENITYKPKKFSQSLRDHISLSEDDLRQLGQLKPKNKTNEH